MRRMLVVADIKQQPDFYSKSDNQIYTVISTVGPPQVPDE